MKLFGITKTNNRKIIYFLGFKIKIRINNNQTEKLETILNYLEYFKARILFEQRFNIKIPAECCGEGNKFELCKVCLGDLRRYWEGKNVRLEDCSQYKYLQTGNEDIYNDYIKKHIKLGLIANNTAWSTEMYQNLIKSMDKEEYNPSICAIVINQDNIIIDGTHRACFLLSKYGPEYEIEVIKVSDKNAIL